ncbi:MAG: 2-hydroxyglutaryl-CoA dehydratase, partial [Kosmotogaceae bacterium]|nr:2-hydroxyglutaryl-CoA dehydratase [Kosmotogaceae bacterium]
IDLWLDKNNASNVLLFSLNSENGYAGMGLKAKLRIWASMIIADEFCNLENALLTLASDRDEAIKAAKEARKIILESVKRDSFSEMTMKLEEICENISRIPLKSDFESAPKVLLSGEIYVRNDEFSRKSLELFFADSGIIMHASPIEEWIYYLDYILLKRYVPTELGPLKRGTKHVEILVKQAFERRIKKILEKSGLYKSHFVDIESMVNTSKDFLNPKLTGEAILTLGAVLFESIDTYDGVISIGPFGCMPTRIAEAVAERGLEHLRENSSKLKREIFKIAGNIPVLFFESDGNPFTPTVESRLESFVVQVKRVKSLSMELQSQKFK